jgi:DNA processing protein
MPESAFATLHQEPNEFAQEMRIAAAVKWFELGRISQGRAAEIAGLSRAVIVVEAAAKSGSLITAKAALDYGREVLSVPGHPFDARASGCNMLIRDGAVLVRSAEDVLEGLGAPAALLSDPVLTTAPLPGPEAPQRPLKDVALLHSMILSRLGPSPLAEDQLMRDLKVTSAQLAPELLNLELEGRIARQPGGLLARLD